MTKRLTSIGLAATAIMIASAAHAQVLETRQDLIVNIGSGTIASLTLGGHSALIAINNGTLGLTLNGNPACVVSPSAGCPAIVNGLRITTNDIPGLALDVDGDTDIVDVREPTTTMRYPVAVVHNGFGFDVPQGQQITFSARMFGSVAGHDLNGERSFGSAPLSAPLSVRYTLVPTEVFAIEGTLPITFTVADSTITGSLSFLLNGVVPFFNTPPIANAGQDVTLQCGGTVTLDGSRSVDLEGQNSIIAYRWFDSNGTLIASTPTTQVTPHLGANSYELVVEDALHGQGRDSVTVTVNADAGTPEFTVKPADVIATTCGTVNIGTAQATAGCGAVTITNDAPAVFKAGVTLVTWKATSTISGLSATFTQRVYVGLGGSEACCPAGSNIIRGTAANDIITGTPGVDCILAFGGQDRIDGAGGNDVISAGDGDDTVSGGEGNDVIEGGSGQDQLTGGNGDDMLVGGDGDDQLNGGAGADAMLGQNGQDRLFGGDGNDQCLGGAGDDQISGEAGDDVLNGNENNNTCTGGTGFDTVTNCTSLDTPESNGTPPYIGTPGYNVCSCKPTKCTDCSAAVTQCNATAGCRDIVQCVNIRTDCNLPHECSSVCEQGRSAAAISIARTLASCFGGC